MTSKDFVSLKDTFGFRCLHHFIGMIEITYVTLLNASTLKQTQKNFTMIYEP